MSESRKLDRLSRSLEEGMQDIGLLLLPVTEEEFWYRTKDGAWSAAEILQHLSLTVDIYLPEIEKTLAEQDSHGRRSALRSLLSRILLKLGPASYLRLPSPRSLDPRYSSKLFSSHRSKQEVLEHFVESHRTLIALMKVAREADYEALSVRIPLLPMLRLPVEQCFLLHVLHLERHMKQLRCVLGE